MTAASRERLENGISSVMHSSISSANEYVSEYVVGETLLSSMSSVAPYLTTSPDDTVFEIVLSVISSTIFAIAKSQISASPFQPWSARSLWVRREGGMYLARDKHVFLLPLQSMGVYSTRVRKTHAFDCGRGQIAHTRQNLSHSPLPCTISREWR